MEQLIRKGFSRCVVFKKEHVKKVEQIIKKLDKFEYEYMPKDWITYHDYPNDKNRIDVVYNGSFEIDTILLKIACAEEKIAIGFVIFEEEPYI